RSLRPRSWAGWASSLARGKRRRACGLPMWLRCWRCLTGLAPSWRAIAKIWPISATAIAEPKRAARGPPFQFGLSATAGAIDIGAAIFASALLLGLAPALLGLGGTGRTNRLAGFNIATHAVDLAFGPGARGVDGVMMRLA